MTTHHNNPPPLEFPHWLQPCEQCQKETPSKILYMQAGLGNACAICGKLRRRRPYVSKANLAELAATGTIKTLKPNGAKGGKNESRLH